MRAIVDAKAFSTAMEKVSAVLKKSSLPILEAVYLRFNGEKCEMTATNLHAWLITEIPAEGDPFCFSFYQNKEALKACRHFEGVMSIEVTPQGDERKGDCKIHLSAGARCADFDGTMDEGAFLPTPSMDGEFLFAANAAKLLKRIDCVQYAVSKGKARTTAYTGVQFFGNSIFAIDGFRAACDMDTSLTVDKPLLLTPDDLSHLKLFADSDVEAYRGKSLVRFVGKGLSLCCHMLDASPTELEKILPKSYEEEVAVSPKAFLGELKYLKDLLPPKDKPYVRFCDGALSLHGSRRNASTKVEISGKNTMPFGFDMCYMTDALKQFANETQVKLKICGTKSPLVIEAEGRSDYALVMPIRIDNVRVA